MAHNIEYNTMTGKHSFFDARFPAWHVLGEIGEGEPVTAWELRERSGQNWEVEKFPLFNPLTGEPTEFYGVCRLDNCEMLSVVGAGYTIIQNEFKFRVMDELIGQIDGAHYETGGVLGKGERVWALASVGKIDILGSGDIHCKYLLGTDSHDGSLSLTFKDVMTRVVCANTLGAALREKGKQLKAKHTRNAESNIWNAVNLLKASEDTFKDMGEKLEFLAQRKVNGQIVSQTLAKIFNLDMTKDLTKQQAEKVLTIKGLFEGNDNNAFPEFRGTGYNLLNAITEYTDHFANSKGSNRDESRALSAMFGAGDQFKRDSMNIVLEMLKNAPETNQLQQYSYGDTSSLVAEMLNK